MCIRDRSNTGKKFHGYQVSIAEYIYMFKEFATSQPLLRNMMGLLGNVAEVPHLRPKLMTRAFVAEFAMLLDSNLDGIEVRIGFQSSCVMAFSIVSLYLYE